MAEFDYKPWWSQATERFSAAEDIAALLKELEWLFDETEKMIQDHKEGDRSLIACHAGCQDCCIVNVSVTLLEGIAITRFLRQWDEPQQREIVAKVDALWTAVRGLEDDERMMVRKKCAFLDASGCCTIYPVRPLFCRGVTSIDVDACRSAIADQAFGVTTEVMMHQFQLDLYKVAFGAIASGLEQSGLDGRSFQLCGLTRYLLAHPDQEEVSLRSSALNWNDLY